MRGLVLFVAGVLVGVAVQATSAQNQPGNPGSRVNHVGVAVPNVPEAAAYYTETMGFREAFRNTNDQGQPTSIYMQASRDTFVELQQANEQRPVGITHYGLVVDDISEAVAMFRQRGATATDPRGPSAFSGAILANVTDLNGIRIELAELGPDSLPAKAAAAWE